MVGGAFTAAAGGGFGGGIFAGDAFEPCCHECASSGTGSDLHGEWQDPAELAVGLAEVVGGTFTGAAFWAAGTTSLVPGVPGGTFTGGVAAAAANASAAAIDSCVGENGLPPVAPMPDGGGLGGGDLPLATRLAGGGFGGGVLPLDIRTSGAAFGGSTTSLKTLLGGGLEGGLALSIGALPPPMPPVPWDATGGAFDGRPVTGGTLEESLTLASPVPWTTTDGDFIGRTVPKPRAP